MPFKNHWTDLLEIFAESVKVYTHCVCEVSQRSESNCIFDDQEIEITYKHYSTLNTWATLMKQKLNYSQYVEQEQDIFRYVKNSELTREIRCHSDRIFPNLHQCYQWYSAPPPPPPPFELCFVSSHFASVWEFSKMLLLNFGMFAISDCPFILSVRLSVHLSVHLSHEAYIRHSFYEMLVARKLSGPKVKVAQVVSSFCWVSSVAPCLFDRFASYLTKVVVMLLAFTVTLHRID